MAKLSPTGKITGAIGPISYTSFRGTTVIRTKPGKGNVKQTLATKNAASKFGKASSISKNIRNAIKPITQDFTDNRMYSRFTAAMLKAMRSIETQEASLCDTDLTILEHFEFHTDHPFDHYCKLHPIIEITDQGNITILLESFTPSDQINSIPTATLTELCFLVTAIDPITGTENRSELHKIPVLLSKQTIDPSHWTSEHSFTNTTVLVTTALFYYKQDKLMGMVGLNGKSFHTGKIVKVFSQV